MAVLIEKLIEKGILKKEEAATLESEIKLSDKTEEEVIIEKGIFPEESLFQLKGEIFGFPFREIEEDNIPPETLKFIPEESAKFYKMIPLKVQGGVLEIGMVYPKDLKAREVLSFLSRQNNFNYEIVLISLSGFGRAIKQYKAAGKEFSRALESLEGELEGEGIEITPRREPEESLLSEDAPIIKMVDVILRYALDGNASDIHIEPFEDKSRVRFRVDGILHSSIFLPPKAHPAIIARIKILSNLKIDETRIPQDGRFSATIYNKKIDLRVSTLPTVLGEKAVMRVLVTEEGAQTLENLGLSGRNMEVVSEAIKRPYGLILATGPTGSGKTTTLYSLLNILNEEKVNIITLEDPIEYFLEGINHSQVKPEIHYGFAQGLRHILRQDPDIIMVGEVRDEETAGLVMHAALTGHIVLSTLHTNNAIGAIPRLIDMGIQPFLLPSALVLVIAQRLVGVLCPDCKQKKKPSKKEQDFITKGIEGMSENTKKDLDLSFSGVYKAKGCKKCNDKGYKGRVGLFEILLMTDELAEIIISSPTEERIWKEANRQGMVTLRQDGIIKVLRGTTSIEEVLRVTEEA